jgi:hypothetical protein
MSLGVGVSSAWKNAPQISIGVSSAWKTVVGMWVGVSGAWKKFHAAVGMADTTISDVQITPDDSIAGFRVRGTGAPTPGIVQGIRGQTLGSVSSTTAGTWVEPSSEAGNYDIMVEQISGTVNVNTGTGPASLNTWIQMNISVTGSFYATRTISTPGVTTAVARLSFRPTGSGSAVASCLITMNAEVEGLP